MAKPVKVSQMLRLSYRMHRLYGRGIAAIHETTRLRLAELVRLAKAESPFYAKRYADIDLERACLADLPPFDKHEFMQDLQSTFAVRDIDAEQAREFVTHKERIGELYQGRYVLAHTSGSTGLRGLFVQDVWGWTVGQALMMKTMGRDPDLLKRLSPRMLPRWEVAVIIPTGGHYTSMLVPAIAPTLRDVMSRIHYIDILEPLERILARLTTVRPVWLHAYPTVMHVLALAQLEGRLNIDPLLITTGSEPFTAKARELVRRAWPRALMTDVYAATEVMPIARECAYGTLHLFADWVIVEPVDELGDPTPPGEMSHKLFVTHLFNRVQPLIRYEMTDSVRFVDKQCACGLPLPALEVGGRTNDTLYLKRIDGTTATLLATPILVAFMEVPHLKQYQVVHERPGLILVRYSVEQGGDPARVAADVRRVFGEYLERHGAGGAATIEPQHVEQIERDQRTHKILQVINKVGRETGR